MTRKLLMGLILGLLLGGMTALRVSAQDEPRDKPRTPQGEATAPTDREKPDAAPRPAREVRERLREARQREVQTRREAPGPEIEQVVNRLKARLQDLREKQKKLVEAKASEQDQTEVREQITRTERELSALRERLAGGREPRDEFEAQARKIEEAGRRIRHIRAAAENLKAAGMDDVAQKLTEQAENMERDVRAARERLAGQREGRGGADPRDAEIRELRQQNERLQAEIRELQEKLEKR
jgi:hypothetical protein